jgi:glycosyltransferase involved in cell wall biosynthesis
MMNLALALADAGQEVYQFDLNTSKHYTKPESIPQHVRKTLHINTSDIDTRVTIAGAFQNLFSHKSYNVIRFYSESVEKDLEKILLKNTFDIVQLETLFVAPYISCIRKFSNAKIVLRAHNVEHVIWERLAVKECNFLKKKYLGLLSGRLKNYELKTLNNIDALVPITQVDEAMLIKFGFAKPCLTLPMSLKIEDYPYNAKEESEMCLFHLGSMDWLPNLEAVHWFLDNCWLKIHELFPEVKLYLAGKSFPDEIKNKNYPNVLCEGTIKDSVAYMQKKQIMIVPLHSGSGMRVKIIQGLALGKTIISTTIGAEGISIENEKNILLADSPDDFINLVKRCLENPDWCKKIGAEGRNFIEQNYSNISIANKLISFYEKLIKS